MNEYRAVVVSTSFKNKYSLMLTKQRRSGVSQIEEHLSTRPGSYSQIFENMQMQKILIRKYSIFYQF